MHKFRFSPRQTKNLIVSMAMAVVIAVPMFAQPLGLASTFAAPAANTNEAQQTALLDSETTISLESAASLDMLDINMNRSLPEADAEDAMLMIGNDVENDTSAPVADANGDIDVEDPEEAASPAEPAAEPVAEPADPIAEVAAHTVYVQKNGVNLRAEPNTGSAVLAQLAMGAKLTATGEMAAWKRVKDASGREGYIADTFVSTSMVFVDKNDSVYVTKNAVNLRQAPASGSGSLGLLSAGTKLTRTGIGDEWTRVKTAAGKTGYVASSFLTGTVPASARTTTASKTTVAAPVNKSGNIVVDAAYSMLGVRYVFGSESRSGVDCSGLILYCYRQAGISVPRSSFEYASFGTAVSLANMQPGDVIAMDTRKSDGRTSITHVGLYVGGGNMIHASSSLGRVVKVSVSQYISYGVKLITIRRIRG